MPNAIKPRRNRQIAYCQRRVPSVVTKPVAGTRYHRLVPDTLDLAERGKLALQAMTSLVEPKFDYEFYFISDFSKNPPFMRMTPDSINCQYKYQEATALLRRLTGSTENLEVDQRWKETSLQRIGEDGLPYWPLKGRAFENLPEVPAAGWLEPALGDPQSDQLCQPAFTARLLSSFALYYREDGSQQWLRAAEGVINRLRDLAIYRDGAASIPACGIKPGAVVPPDMQPPDWMWASHQGWLIQALVQYYRVTDWPPALAFAEDLAKFTMGPAGMFDDAGRFIGFDHFHHHTQSVLAIADLALVTGKAKYKRWAKKCYDQGKAMGDVLVGFFPEGQRGPNGEYTYGGGKEQTAETCEVADMIAIGLKLAELGYDACWDDVDKWVRNQFAENQMTKADWVQRRHDILGTPQNEHQCLRCDTTDRVAERHIGAFAGWPTANDLIRFDRPQWPWSFMHCCTGNGARAVYYAWENILAWQDKSKTLGVNLLLNRASRWADVDSHLPYRGQVDVHVKRDCRLEVRLPDYVRQQVSGFSVQVSGRHRKSRNVTFSQIGRRLQLGRVKKGERVTVTFPLVEQTMRTSIGGKPYTVIVKGHDVVFIDPPGQWCPYYQRDHYRQSDTRWVERERFVAHQPPLHW